MVFRLIGHSATPAARPVALAGQVPDHPQDPLQDPELLSLSESLRVPMAELRIFIQRVIHLSMLNASIKVLKATHAESKNVLVRALGFSDSPVEHGQIIRYERSLHKATFGSLEPRLWRIIECDIRDAKLLGLVKLSIQEERVARIGSLGAAGIEEASGAARVVRAEVEEKTRVTFSELLGEHRIPPPTSISHYGPFVAIALNASEIRAVFKDTLISFIGLRARDSATSDGSTGSQVVSLSIPFQGELDLFVFDADPN